MAQGSLQEVNARHEDHIRRLQQAIRVQEQEVEQLHSDLSKAHDLQAQADGERDSLTAEVADLHQSQKGLQQAGQRLQAEVASLRQAGQRAEEDRDLCRQQFRGVERAIREKEVRRSLYMTPTAAPLPYWFTTSFHSASPAADDSLSCYVECLGKLWLSGERPLKILGPLIRAVDSATSAPDGHGEFGSCSEARAGQQSQGLAKE